MPDADLQQATGSKPLRGFRVVSGLTLASRFAGLARDVLMAGLFGTGWVLDTFTVAFRIPGMFRRLFGEGAMAAAFLPQFVHEDQQHGREAASDLFSAVARQLTRWLGLLVIAAELALLSALLLLDLSDRGELLVHLTILLLPYSLLICVAALHCAALNGAEHFWVPAMLPIVLNIAWFSGGLVAMTFLPADEDQVRLIALSILLGGTMQLAVAILQAQQFGIRIQPDVISNELRRRVNHLFRQMGPVLFGLSIMQLNAMVDSLLAWLLAWPADALPGFLERFRLPEGTASALYLGQRLFQFPLGVFGVALGTVLFPRFARHASAGNSHKLERDIVHGLQLVLVAGIPASAGLWLMAEPVTDLLFRYGAFSDEDVQLTARMIRSYGTGVWVFCGLLIVNKVFYAAGDQFTAARLGLICVAMNLVLNVAMLPWLQEAALPLASVLATLFQLVLALKILRQRHLKTGFGIFIPVLWRSILATCLMAGCCLVLQSCPAGENSTWGRLLRTALPIGVCVAVYWVLLRLTGMLPQRLLAEPFEQNGRGSLNETDGAD